METQNNFKKEIISGYTQYVLGNKQSPNSINSFVKSINIDKKEFNNYYNSFEDVANDVYSSLYDETFNLITADKSYKSLDAEKKLLTFYTTFFRLLQKNRSYAVITLKGHENIMDKIHAIHQLKLKFKGYLQSLKIETFDFKQEEINLINKQSLEELAWKQFLFTLNLWLENPSIDNEQTNLIIKKHVNTSVSLLNIASFKKHTTLRDFVA